MLFSLWNLVQPIALSHMFTDAEIRHEGVFFGGLGPTIKLYKMNGCVKPWLYQFHDTELAK